MEQNGMKAALLRLIEQLSTEDLRLLYIVALELIKSYPEGGGVI